MINFKHHLIGAALLVCSALPMAAPFANVASIAQVGRPLTISGGGFEPGALINLRVLGPGNSVSAAAVVVAADGAITHTLVAPNDGAYVVQITQSDGRVAVSSLKFHVSR